MSISGTSSTSIYWQWENFANYIKTFDKHTINAMLGMSYQESTYDYITSGFSANGADAITNRDPSFWYLNYGDPSASKSIQGEKTRTAKYSYFGRVGYDFAGNICCKLHFVPMQPICLTFLWKTLGILPCRICRMDYL